MRSIIQRHWPRAATLGVLLGVCSTALADWKVNMPVGVTPISHAVYHLHMLMLWVCVVIGIIVFGAIFYSIVKFRKSAGAQAAHFHHSTTAEIIWTVIPFIILVVMAIPATRTLLAMEDTTNPDLTIRVTGYQWKWHYDYPAQGISFYSDLAESSLAAIHKSDPESVKHYLRNVDHPLVVPVGKRIRFLITGGDVIHSWWVPALGMKKDAIPGYVNAMWAVIEKAGVYRGQCAELCGWGHAYMPIVVDARSPGDFQKWVDKTKKAESKR